MIDWDIERTVRSPWAAGLLGSIVALKFAPGTTWPERAVNVGAGALCAGFCAPALVDWLHIEPVSMRSGAAFAVGMFGLSVAAAVIDGVRELKLAEVITGWISRKR